MTNTQPLPGPEDQPADQDEQAKDVDGGERAHNWLTAHQAAMRARVERGWRHPWQDAIDGVLKGLGDE